MGLFITFALGLFIIIGAFASYLARENEVVEYFSVSMALGTLGTLAILELIPEAVEHIGENNWWEIVIFILLGFILLKGLDLFIPEHDSHYSHRGQEHSYTEDNMEHVGIISAIAVTLHNIIEGMAVYSMSQQSLMTGLMVAIGVGLHNIPMGMILYSTLHRKKERYLMLGIAASSTFVGGVIMWLLWGVINDHIIGILIAVTLGMIIYIVIFELIPMILHIRKWKVMIPGILIGVAFILVSLLLE